MTDTVQTQPHPAAPRPETGDSTLRAHAVPLLLIGVAVLCFVGSLFAPWGDISSRVTVRLSHAIAASPGVTVHLAGISAGNVYLILAPLLLAIAVLGVWSPLAFARVMRVVTLLLGVMLFAELAAILNAAADAPIDSSLLSSDLAVQGQKLSLDLGAYLAFGSIILSVAGAWLEALLLLGRRGARNTGDATQVIT
jgi:hypothetical protein